jgi:TatA/E family protein of Tat protein translocase
LRESLSQCQAIEQELERVDGGTTPGAAAETNPDCLMVVTSAFSGHRLQSFCWRKFSPVIELRSIGAVVFLILESLGSTELLFILVMALVFFGPRKLPQLSRTLGKNVAEFRRASEEFKRTWEREVTLEESNTAVIAGNPETPPYENSILNQENVSKTLRPPTIEPIAADQIIPRQPTQVDALHSSDTNAFAANGSETLRKRDWI